MRRCSPSRDFCRAFVIYSVAVLGFGVQTGCKSPPTEAAKVAVEGKVTHQGTGVPYVLVFFYGPANARLAEAATDKAGSFGLSCPPGTYQIALKAVPPGAGESPGGASTDGTLIQAPDQKGLKQIPPKYLNAATSGLTITIPEGGRTDVQIVIK